MQTNVTKINSAYGCKVFIIKYLSIYLSKFKYTNVTRPIIAGMTFFMKVETALQ